MRTIKISLPNNPYIVYLESGLLDHFSSYLNSVDDIVIITDSGIPTQYLQTVKDQFVDPLVFIVPEGESSKSFLNYQNILEEMVEKNISKSSTIIALGGGVVGDLSGFIASTYMRGISFIQIPTTLLSQIDSSVGGKVAINSKSAKNAIGSFYHPDLVIIDPLVLETLEKRQLHSGLAELIKYGVIKDPTILDLLNQETWYKSLPLLIEKAISIKRDIVLEDELDQGVRHILNFGHTLGHAVEQHSAYTIYHGEAVAIGMAYMASKKPYYKKLIALLNKFDLPYTLPTTLDVLLPYITKDKKVHGKNLHFVVVNNLGSAEIVPVPIHKIELFLEELI